MRVFALAGTANEVIGLKRSATTTESVHVSSALCESYCYSCEDDIMRTCE